MTLDFLKKHYEKLILLVMLLAFISMMIHVMQIAGQTQEISDDQLKIPRRDADYKPKDRNAADFAVEKLTRDTQLIWESSRQREKIDPGAKDIVGLFSDLVVASPMARCPHCDRIIPRYAFENRHCIEAQCNGALVKPPPRPKERRRMITENDSDGDGMPNEYEREKGFNPNNSADAMYDADKDGFGNLYEYERKTDPKDPRSRPPLWYRLRYVDLRQVELPVRLMAINTMDSTDPAKWNIQLNHVSTRMVRGQAVERVNTENRQIGQPGFDEVQIEDRVYKIVKAQVIPGKGEENKGSGRIWLEQVVTAGPDGKMPEQDKLQMEVGKVLYSNDKRLIVEDVGVPGHGVQYVCKLNNVLRIGNRRTGVESYVLKEIDIKKHTALFAVHNSKAADPTRDRDNKKIIVTRDSEIPEEYRVMAESRFNDGDIDNNGEGGASNAPESGNPSGEAPRGRRR